MSYSFLAPFYDRLTWDVDYPAFADFYEKIFKSRGISPKLVLDLACGTGSMTRELARRGYEMIGADASADMLMAAFSKAGETEGIIEPVYLNQAMEELDLYGTVDAAVCCLDGINYAQPGKLKEIFRRLYLFIAPGGVLIFDINSPKKLRGMDGKIFVDETEDVLCLWRAEFDEDENACFYGIDIFSERNGLWERSFEEHVEYVHEPETLVRLLETAGFKDIKLYGNLSDSPPEKGEDRIFISAVR